jgi:ornithine decarboxylase
MIPTIQKYLALNKKIETPKYIYFPEELRANIRKFSKFEKDNIQIFYAVKANNHNPLIKELIRNGFGFDVASKEEINLVISAGCHPSKITFSAPSKKEEDIKYANEKGIKYFAFDSQYEAEKILKNVKNPILFARIAHHSKDAIFNLSSKFGMNESYFKFILRKAKKENWPLKGITFHVGSQNSSPNSWNLALKHVESLLKHAQNLNIDFSYLNIGGGLPAAYSADIQPIENYIEKIIDYCRYIKFKFPNLEVFVEPGRAIAANTMVLACSIIDYKPYKSPPILIVDTGVFNGIMEPIEHFEYPVYVSKLLSPKKKYFRIAGFSCEGYDIIRNKVLLPSDIKIGDKIYFLYAGAYTFVYSKFHMVPYPEILESKK